MSKRLEACLEEVRRWMTAKWLKLNNSKTEFITFGSKQILSNLSGVSVTLGASALKQHWYPSRLHTENEKVVSSHMQSSMVSFTSYIYKIRKYLTEEQTKSMLHAQVT